MEDMQSVIRIERTSFSLPWSENSFLSEIHKTRSLSKVAVDGEEVIGYVCTEFIGDEGHLLNLAVSPDRRGEGVAKALVGKILEELKVRDCRFLYLEVRDSNEAAKKLYQGFSFRIVGKRKEYYVAPIEDAAIMMREL